MHLPKPHRIHTKFIAGLMLAAILLGIATSLGFYLHMRNVLEQEVRDKARIILTHVDSVQRYVRDVLRPTMYQRLPAAFVIQAMSSSYILPPDHVLLQRAAGWHHLPPSRHRRPQSRLRGQRPRTRTDRILPH